MNTVWKEEDFRSTCPACDKAMVGYNHGDERIHLNLINQRERYYRDFLVTFKVRVDGQPVCRFCQNQAVEIAFARRNT